MKKALFFTLFIGALAFGTSAQQSYFTSQGEYIFSWSGYTGDTGNGNTRTRFSLFPNTEIAYNLDTRGIFGTYFGLSFKNIGLNWGDPEKHKRRALSIGVPLVLKFGDLENDNFFFLGGEIEALLHYKKKDWSAAGEKRKSTEWLSDELNLLQPSVMVGYCMNKFMIKAKYYLFDFFNEDYANANGDLIYSGYQSNIFYLGISFRQDVGNNNFDFEEDETDDNDDGFDFGYKPSLDLLYLNNH